MIPVFNEVMVEGEDYVDWYYKSGAIDLNGNLTVPVMYDGIWGFREGVSAVRLNSEDGDYRIGYIDSANNTVIPFEFKWVSNFFEGTAVGAKEMTEEGMPVSVGIIDKTGAYVIEPQFENARASCEGLIAVKVDGLWGYIKSPVVYNVEAFDIVE